MHIDDCKRDQCFLTSWEIHFNFRFKVLSVSEDLFTVKNAYELQVNNCGRCNVRTKRREIFKIKQRQNEEQIKAAAGGPVWTIQF